MPVPLRRPHHSLRSRRSSGSEASDTPRSWRIPEACIWGYCRSRISVPDCIPRTRIAHAYGHVPIVDRSSSYKRVKGRSHTVKIRISMHLHKPRVTHKSHATSQPLRFSHTQTQHRLTTGIVTPDWPCAASSGARAEPSQRRQFSDSE